MSSQVGALCRRRRSRGVRSAASFQAGIAPARGMIPAPTGSSPAGPGPTEGATGGPKARDWHAGPTPAVLIHPRVGFNPTIPLAAAGTRPEPAVSVPRARSTNPAATATADPALEPPATRSGHEAFG